MSETTTPADATIAQQPLKAAPKRSRPAKKAGAKKAAPKGKKAVKKSTNAPKVKPAAAASRPAGSKSSVIHDLLCRTSGATLKEIMEATGWRAHSVRGFISTASKKKGLAIDSSRNEAGERLYRIAK